MTDGLLLLHAWPIDARMWERQLAAVPEDLPVAAPHLPGFGDSEAAGDVMTMRAAAEWALERDPTLGVVGDALRRRHGDPAARIEPAQVARLLAVVRARVAKARDGT